MRSRYIVNGGDVLTESDRRAWRQEANREDIIWQKGFARGRQERWREWAGFALGYLLGRDRHWGVHVVTWVSVFLLVRYLIAHWWVVVLLLACTQVPRGVRMLWALRPKKANVDAF